jgi:uncharacterized protein YegL
MTRQGLTEIVAVIDRSGSMDTVKEDAIGGFNTFLKKQQELPGECTFSMTLFNTEFDMPIRGTPIKQVLPLDDTKFIPSGMTALRDAVGKTIGEVEERYQKTHPDQRPEKILIAIITDGHENSSQEYTHDQIEKLITEKKETKYWEFVFLGSNINAKHEGGNLGVSVSNCFTFANTGASNRRAYSSQLCNAATSYRTTGNVSFEDTTSDPTVVSTPLVDKDKEEEESSG